MSIVFKVKFDLYHNSVKIHSTVSKSDGNSCYSYYAIFSEIVGSMSEESQENIAYTGRRFRRFTSKIIERDL